MAQTYTLPNDPEIAVLANLMIEASTRGKAWHELGSYDELMVMMTITWGRATQKHLDASSVAQILSLPRTTVKRILDRMVQKGLYTTEMDGKRKLYFRKKDAFGRLKHAEYDLMVVEMARLTIKAAKQLTKMDTSPLPDKTRNG